MKEHIKHVSDGVFTVVSVFIGLVFLLFVMMAFGSMLSKLFDDSTLSNIYFYVALPTAIILGIYHSNKKHSK